MSGFQRGILWFTFGMVLGLEVVNYTHSYQIAQIQERVAKLENVMEGK